MEPDWPPRASARYFAEGRKIYGSTGQLFEVRNGQWRRVEPPTQESDFPTITIKPIGDTSPSEMNPDPEATHG